MGFFSNFKNCSKKLPRTCLVLMIVLVLPLVVSAQELVLHRFVGQVPDARFEEILYLAAGVALTQQGLSSIRDADTADLILSTSYSMNSSVAELDYSLSMETAPGTELANIALTVPIDPAMDSAIAGAIRLLFEAAGVSRSPSPDAKIYGLLADPSAMSDHALALPPGMPPAEPAVAVLAMTRPSDSEPSTTGYPADLPQAELPPGKEPAAGTAAPADQRPGFTASVSTAGIMFVGEAMDYLRYGVSGALGFGLSWKRPARSLTLEARASIGRAFNDIGVVGGPLYLGTAVLGLELGTGTDDAFKAGLEIAGGAAFMTVAGTSGTLMKTVPCLELGTSIGIPLGHGLFFCAGLRFMTVVDREITIMGISPAITVGTEL